MPLTILELLLKIVLVAMEGQTPEQRATMWGIYLRDLEWWRQRFKIDPAPAQAVARAQRRRTR